jgi:hypothetical protein
MNTNCDRPNFAAIAQYLATLHVSLLELLRSGMYVDVKWTCV